MRDTSPEYLQHFMSYVDGLLWLEQADSQSKPAPKVAPRGRHGAGRARQGRESLGAPSPAECLPPKGICPCLRAAPCRSRLY
jgi:hypothetical protein